MLLEANRALVFKDCIWRKKDADYLKRLNLANEELADVISSGV